MQVQHHPGAGVAGRGERAPAERRVHVVGVHHPRAGAPDRVRDLVGGEPAAQQAGRRPRPAELGRVPLQHLHVLAELLADQPREIVDRPLLAAGMAVAVVQKQDHGSSLS